AGEGEGAGGRLMLPVTAREPDFVRSYARLSSRRHELALAYPWQHAEELLFRLPAGYAVERLPAARALDTPFGRFRLDAEVVEGHQVRIRSELDVRRHTIP